MPEIPVRPLTALLIGLVRSGDLGEIAANTYVAPVGKGAETPAPGRLAGPAGSEAGEGFDMAAADTAPSTTEPGRSLVGLRLPLNAGGGAFAVSAPTTKAPAAGTTEGMGRSRTGPASPSLGSDAGSPRGADPLRGAATPTAMSGEATRVAKPGFERPPPFGPPVQIQGADRPAAESEIAGEAGDALRRPMVGRELSAQLGRGGPESERGAAQQDAVSAALGSAAQERPLSDAQGLPALDAWSPAIGIAAEQQVERAGIIASFILNAAMIPGWPPPRPFAAPAPESVRAALIMTPGLSEAGIEARMRRDGVRRTLLARMRALLARLTHSRRLQVMLGLTILLGAIAAIEAELGDVARHADTDDIEAARRKLSV